MSILSVLCFFGAIFSLLSVSHAQTVYGLGGFKPVYRSGPDDLIGIRFRFRVIENQSQSLRLIFGFHRLHAPNSQYNYIIETNVYSGRYVSYPDSTCTTWPLAGNYIERESSLRLAIPDYAFYFGQQPGITTGIRTSDPTTYPIQTYLIDNIPKLYKSDAINQFDANNIETLITVERGDTLTDVSRFNRCDRPLLARVYRKWTIRTEMPTKPVIVCDFVLPESGARYLTVNEAMSFASEYLNGAGFFTVHYWDLASIRESKPIWRADTVFVSSSQYDGNGTNFGIRVVNVDGQDRIEFSNHAGNSYIPKDTQFTIAAPPVTSSEDFFLSQINFSLEQNFPNPFNSSTTISFTVASRSYVSLKVFDVMGREVANLVSDVIPAGRYSQQWNATGMPSGVYFYRLYGSSFIETKKLMLLD